MAVTVEQLSQAISGMQALSKNGLRYPFPDYGIQLDVTEGMGASYPKHVVR